MGVSHSNRREYASNVQFVDRLKSALAINKRDRTVYPSKMSPYPNRVRTGVYKLLDTKERIDYETMDIIGRGSFGIVYSARNQYGQQVAIKCKKFLPDHDLMQKSTLLFRDEFEALFNLEHVNIVRLLGVELDRREVDALVMEFVMGDTLDKYIKMFRPLSELMIQSTVKQIIDALAYMHSKHVMHRDMKSSNVMLVGGRFVKIIDFGMAKHFDDPDNAITASELSSSTVVGTVPYMAPELISFGRYNAKIDIWSVGVIIFEMITGDVFMRSQARHLSAMNSAVSLAHAPSPVNVQQLSPIANHFMQSCLIKNPDFRPHAGNLLQHPFINRCMNPCFTMNRLIYSMPQVPPHLQQRPITPVPPIMLNNYYRRF